MLNLTIYSYIFMLCNRIMPKITSCNIQIKRVIFRHPHIFQHILPCTQWFQKLSPSTYSVKLYRQFNQTRVKALLNNKRIKKAVCPEEKRRMFTQKKEKGQKKNIIKKKKMASSLRQKSKQFRGKYYVLEAILRQFLDPSPTTYSFFKKLRITKLI